MNASAKRILPVLACCSLLASAIPCLATPTISEIRIDNPGPDTDEYFELSGVPLESLDGLTYVVIGDAAWPLLYGVIESVTPLDGLALGANGFLAVASESLSTTCGGYGAVGPMVFENSDNVTHLLVSGFNGQLGQDLDLDDDGVLDSQPWAQIIDCVALIEQSQGGDPVYCTTTVGPDLKHTLPIGKPREYVPAHVARCGAAWYIGNLYGDPPCATDSPGGPNAVCGAVPPEIPALTSRPCAPGSNDVLTIEATVTDFNGDLSSVSLNYRQAGAPSYTMTPMMNMGGSLWTATVGPFPAQALVEYYVTAADAAQRTTSNPSTAPLHPAMCRIGLTPIAAVQTTTAPDASCLTHSDMEGQAVSVTGIVTHRAVEFSSRFFYVQQGVTPFSGIKVYVPTQDFLPKIGDQVVVSGIVEEHRCQTQIRLFPGCGTVVGTGPVPIRVLAAVGDIGLEENESMLVEVPGPISVVTGWQVADATNGRGPSFTLSRFRIAASAESAWVGDDTFYPDDQGYSYAPSPGDVLPRIRGIVAASPEAAEGGALRLEPRRDPDVELPGMDAPGDGAPVVIDALRLAPARPSPTRAVTTIGFEVPAAGWVSLRVYDAGGRLVRDLFAQEYSGPARGETSWDGLDNSGSPVAAGTYFYRLAVGERSATRKITILR